MASKVQTEGTVRYEINGPVALGRLEDGTIFVIDSNDVERIRGIPFRLIYEAELPYIADADGRKMESYLLNSHGAEHISNDTLDNRKANLRKRGS